MDVRGRGFKELVGVDDALRIFFGALSQYRVGSEPLNTSEALGRFLAEDIVADVNIPTFNRSAMDGYAVVARDTMGASENKPVILKIVGEMKIGERAPMSVRIGQAVAVATGSAIPEGADSVVMIERTSKRTEGEVEVYKEVKSGQNISGVGEDIMTGATVLRKGTELSPADIGILTALGRRRVAVFKKPRVAVLSTGNELVDDRRSVADGKIVDVNRHIISAMLLDEGAVPSDLGIASDNLSDITRRLKKGLETTDAILVSAGSSVGTSDLVPQAIGSLGKPGMLVHGIAIRPALPTGLAIVNGIPIVSLPGFPVSAMVAFMAFVSPLLLRMRGGAKAPRPMIRAKMAGAVTTAPNLRTYLRVILKRIGSSVIAEPLKLPGSTILTSMVRANGLVIIPEGKGKLDAGEEVEVIVLRPVQEG